MKIKREIEIILTFPPPWVEGELLLSCFDGHDGGEFANIHFDEVLQKTLKNLLPDEKKEVVTELAKRLRAFLEKLENFPNEPEDPAPPKPVSCTRFG